MPVCPPIAISLPIPTGAQCLVNGESYDRGLMHFRRYDMLDLEAKLRAAGLTPTERSHLGFTVFPAFWLTKKLSRPRGRNADAGPQGASSTRPISRSAPAFSATA